MEDVSIFLTLSGLMTFKKRHRRCGVVYISACLDDHPNARSTHPPIDPSTHTRACMHACIQTRPYNTSHDPVHISQPKTHRPLHCFIHTGTYLPVLERLREGQVLREGLPQHRLHPLLDILLCGRDGCVSVTGRSVGRLVSLVGSIRPLVYYPIPLSPRGGNAPAALFGSGRAGAGVIRSNPTRRPTRPPRHTRSRDAPSWTSYLGLVMVAAAGVVGLGFVPSTLAGWLASSDDPPVFLLALARLGWAGDRWFDGRGLWWGSVGVWFDESIQSRPPGRRRQ